MGIGVSFHTPMIEIMGWRIFTVIKKLFPAHEFIRGELKPATCVVTISMVYPLHFIRDFSQ